MCSDHTGKKARINTKGFFIQINRHQQVLMKSIGAVNSPFSDTSGLFGFSLYPAVSICV